MAEYDKDFTYIACQLSDYTLDEWLRKEELHPPGNWADTAARLTKDLLCGLHHLHSGKILHRDLKVSFRFVTGVIGSHSVNWLVMIEFKEPQQMRSCVRSVYIFLQCIVYCMP